MSLFPLKKQVSICQQHLLPSLLLEHGLGPQLVSFPRPTLEGVVNGGFVCVVCVCVGESVRRGGVEFASNYAAARVWADACQQAV